MIGFKSMIFDAVSKTQNYSSNDNNSTTNTFNNYLNNKQFNNQNNSESENVNNEEKNINTNANQLGVKKTFFKLNTIKKENGDIFNFLRNNNINESSKNQIINIKDSTNNTNENEGKNKDDELNCNKNSSSSLFENVLTKALKMKFKNMNKNPLEINEFKNDKEGNQNINITENLDNNTNNIKLTTDNIQPINKSENKYYFSKIM